MPKLVFAQKTVENFPVQFTQFNRSYSLINPASIGADVNNKATLIYQKPLQGFEGVSTYALTVHFIPYKKKQTTVQKNIVGIRFYSDKEGAYINRNRLYGMYAFHTRLLKNLNFAGGIDFGTVNFSIKSTPSTGGSSNYVFDSNTGIWIYNSGFHFGVSLNQVFKNKIQPIEELTVLPVHANFTLAKTIFKSSVAEIKPHILVTLPYYSEISIRACIESIFWQYFNASVGLNYNHSVFFTFGVMNYELLQQKINIAVSYELQTQAVTYKLNTIELSMGYEF